ncbi:HD domain-containing protein [Nonomuraea phyllanthi]|uniref:HD-GYP domain-containing protein n=1 Tax=Nonomuraea phyllanthi TaxID=2219224 RepID=UPI001293E614|nr:HD-GYP domain-containing protein [Nonomuraea phyllanthi]QFY12976.1 HD domain-containing protein [Nonomuraea phyllanthi]
MHVESPDPSQVHTVPELISALRALRAGRSYTDLDKAANPGNRPKEGLPSSTLSDLLNKGRASRETLEVFLRACAVPREQWRAWEDARERALTADVPGTAGLIRVAQAEPRRLGVHAAIDAPGATGDLPAYVLRDTDTAPRGVRDLLAKASGRGGMVVLVGESSVGKSRCAYEAIAAVLPHWWLLHPADAGQVRQIAAQATGRLVVWLDELQRYVGGPAGLSAATVRVLLQAGAVLIATIWPERHSTYTAMPGPAQPDRYAAERELLDLADVVHLPSSFSATECERAEAVAASGDQRIALALRSEDCGLTQIIAAAPQLVHRWRGADPYAAAVLNAAIDATRLGVVSPLSPDLLRAAAPGYCDARRRAAAPPGWFETALAYATGTLNGATAALAPVTDTTTMGQITGYQVADYLQQHAGQQRRVAEVPDTCWQALVDHLTDPADQTRVGHAAQHRLLYRHARDLYRHALRPGGGQATGLLATLLVGQGRTDDALALWRAQADAGEGSARTMLAGLLDERNRAARELARRQADASPGDRAATVRMAGLLVAQGRPHDAPALWRARAEAGHLVTASERLYGGVTADDLAGMLMTALDVKSPHTRRHSERVSRLATMIGDRMGMRPDVLEAVRLGGLFHDIGKLAVPDTVLSKDGPLTDEEYTLIQSHTSCGVSVVAGLVELFGDLLAPAARIVLTDAALQGILHHHERFDGRGYPRGLAGTEIPESARVIAVADVFDAITAGRAHRPARSIEAALEIMTQEAGTSFDPQMLAAFLTIADSRRDQLELLLNPRPAGNDGKEPI